MLSAQTEKRFPIERGSSSFLNLERNDVNFATRVLYAIVLRIGPCLRLYSHIILWCEIEETKMQISFLALAVSLSRCRHC